LDQSRLAAGHKDRRVEIYSRRCRRTPPWIEGAGVNQTPHLVILLDQIESIDKRCRAQAKYAAGNDDRDYYLGDLIRECDALNAAIAELRRELDAPSSENRHAVGNRRAVAP
jgi:hypothetical protein